MENKYRNLWFLPVLPLIFVAWYFFSKQADKPLRELPYFGPRQAIRKSDTAFHTVPSFSFTDQHGHPFTQKDLEGKLYVTEFFFTSCQSICPVMNRHLDRVYALHKNDRDFLILSHTVDPETDSVPVLNEYARQHGVDTPGWVFVTGEKKDLYSLARKGYLLDADEHPLPEEDFVHTQNFALVDWERHIRGYYDGTDSADVERLIREIDMLKKEHAYLQKSN